ncbi:MAG: hypothetical protein ABI658_12135 [Acidimicrobiales bacterium]
MRLDPGDDRGTTLFEVLVATMMFVVIMATVFALLQGALTRERGEDASSEVDASLAIAIERFSADVRHARSLVAPLTGQDPRQIITLDVTEPDGRQHRVRWRVTTTIAREELDLIGGVSTTQTLLQNVLPTDPTFEYFTATGVGLAPGVATPADLARCTARVSVDVRVDPTLGRREIERRTAIAVPAIGNGEAVSC